MNNHMFRCHYCCSILRFDKDSSNKDQRLTNQSKETHLRGAAMHVLNFLPMLSCSLFNYLPASFILYSSICSSVRMLLFCCDIRGVKTVFFLNKKNGICVCLRSSVYGDCVTFFRPKQHQEAAPFF